MPVTINGDGSIAGLSVGGLGSGVVNTATIARSNNICFDARWFSGNKLKMLLELKIQEM